MHDAAGRGETSISSALNRLKGAQKPPHGTPAYSRFVNRPLGRYVAAVAYRCGLTPNQVSVVSACFSFVSVFVLATARPSAWLSVGVGAGLCLGYVIDSADGQVARLRGGGSLTGEWLDHMIDCVKLAALHMAVLIHMYRFFPGVADRTLLLPISYAVVNFSMFFGLMLTDQLRRRAAGGARSVTGSLSLWRALIILPTDFGVLALVCGTVGWPHIFIVGYATMFAGSLLFLVAALIKWYVVLRALDQDSSAVRPDKTPERSMSARSSDATAV